MTFTPVSDAARAELRKATAKVVDSIKKRVDPAVIDMVMAQAAKN